MENVILAKSKQIFSIVGDQFQLPYSIVQAFHQDNGIQQTDASLYYKWKKDYKYAQKMLKLKTLN